MLLLTEDLNLDTLLSNRVQKIKPSPTLAIAAKAKALKTAGRDIIDLGAGEPDFDTPQHIKDAATVAIKAGYTKYTAVEGTLSLRQAIANKFALENQLTYTPEQILVSCGAKQSIYNLAQAILDAGDEVIIPAPYWVSYPDITLLCDAIPVIINTGIDQQFKISPGQLEQSITAKTKLLILNSPSNPSGVAYSKQELVALGKVLQRYPQVYVLSDDIYEHILWSKEPFCNILMACPELYDRAIVVNGVSKVYAMTGWRIGYAAANNTIIKAMAKIQGQSTSNACSIAQYAAEAALNGGLADVKTMAAAFKARHDYLVTELNKINGVKCLPGEGTFYAFCKVQGLLEQLNINDDTKLAEYILDKVDIALVPGSAFGAPGYLRLSFATSMDVLRDTVARLNRLTQK